jgi:arylsulfatase A-like enzyme
MKDSNKGGYDWGSTSATSERSIAEKVKEYGYKAYAVGKWHVGERHYRFTPTGRGFHRFYGQWTNSDHFQHCHYKDNRGFDLHYEEQGWSDSMDSSVPYHRYVTEGIGKYSAEIYKEAAYRFLTEHKMRYPEVPFFLYYAMYANHMPMEAPHDYYTLGDCTDSKYPSANRKTLCAMSAAMDVALANLTSLLESQFNQDNYVVVITGDNGGSVEWGSNNTPLTGGKGDQYEGGIRNHAVVWGNSADLRKVRGKPYRGGFMHLVDWHATFVELASLGMTPGESHIPKFMSGHSVWHSIVTETASPVTKIISASEGSESWLNWYVRVGEWKLKINAKTWLAGGHADSAMELYHIGTDDEECDLSSGASRDDQSFTRQCSKNLVDSNTQKKNELMEVFKSMKQNQRVTEGDDDLDECPDCVNDMSGTLWAEFSSKSIIPCNSCDPSPSSCSKTATRCCNSVTIAYPDKSGFPKNTACPEYWKGE